MRIRKGDLFAKIAKPTARLIDFLFCTNLENCQSCYERRKIMNEQTVWQIIKLLCHKTMNKILRR